MLRRLRLGRRQVGGMGNMNGMPNQHMGPGGMNGEHMMGTNMPYDQSDMNTHMGQGGGMMNGWTPKRKRATAQLRASDSP